MLQDYKILVVMVMTAPFSLSVVCKYNLRETESPVSIRLRKTFTISDDNVIKVIWAWAWRFHIFSETPILIIILIKYVFEFHHGKCRIQGFLCLNCTGD